MSHLTSPLLLAGCAPVAVAAVVMLVVLVAVLADEEGGIGAGAISTGFAARTASSCGAALLSMGSAGFMRFVRWGVATDEDEMDEVEEADEEEEGVSMDEWLWWWWWLIDEDDDDDDDIWW